MNLLFRTQFRVNRHHVRRCGIRCEFKASTCGDVQIHSKRYCKHVIVHGQLFPLLLYSMTGRCRTRPSVLRVHQRAWLHRCIQMFPRSTGMTAELSFCEPVGICARPYTSYNRPTGDTSQRYARAPPLPSWAQEATSPFSVVSLPSRLPMLCFPDGRGLHAARPQVLVRPLPTHFEELPTPCAMNIIFKFADIFRVMMGNATPDAGAEQEPRQRSHTVS